jgi:hypothetical protein
VKKIRQLPGLHQAMFVGTGAAQLSAGNFKQRVRHSGQFQRTSILELIQAFVGPGQSDQTIPSVGNAID